MYRISSEIPASSSPAGGKVVFVSLAEHFPNFRLISSIILTSCLFCSHFWMNHHFCRSNPESGKFPRSGAPRIFYVGISEGCNVNRKVREWYFVTFTQSCNILFAPFPRHRKRFCCVNIERPGNGIQFLALISRKIAKVTFASATKARLDANKFINQNYVIY